MTISLIDDKNLKVFFEYFGIFIFGLISVKAIRKLLNNVLTFYFHYGEVDFKKYGKWAVVTGCTDGIGKAYVDQLAKRGMSIVLISRTLEKLEQQAKEIKEKFPSIETLVIAADFTEQDSIYNNLREKLFDLDIGVLFNNVGMSYQHPEYFDIFGQSDKTINNLINCNITSLTKMTAIILPNMVKKRKGIIINNSSASGRVPTPFLTVYSASKAYVDFFSRALNIEYESKGIIVQSLCPYFVSTKLSLVRSSWSAPKPNTYASSALNTIGSQRVTNGCVPHNLQGWLYEDIIPRSIFDRITFSIMSDNRSRALKKIQRKQQESTKKD